MQHISLSCGTEFRNRCRTMFKDLTGSKSSCWRQYRPKASGHASPIPTPDEDKEVMHSAFLHAFETAQPERAHIPGMMEFAGAILSRTKIPSQQYSDPLMHIFDEFDSDGDGSLTAHEVAGALRSRDVKISDDQAAMFIEVVDLNNSHKVERSEFRDLILHMAAADLHSRQADGTTDNAVLCSWERDDEIQGRLKTWTDTLLSHRNTKTAE